jgi:hypothetical protein
VTTRLAKKKIENYRARRGASNARITSARTSLVTGHLRAAPGVCRYKITEAWSRRAYRSPLVDGAANVAAETPGRRSASVELVAKTGGGSGGSRRSKGGSKIGGGGGGGPAGGGGGPAGGGDSEVGSQDKDVDGSGGSGSGNGNGGGGDGDSDGTTLLDSAANSASTKSMSRNAVETCGARRAASWTVGLSDRARVGGVAVGDRVGDNDDRENGRVDEEEDDRFGPEKANGIDACAADADVRAGAGTDGADGGAGGRRLTS